MADLELIKVEIPVSRKDLKLLARPGKPVASRDEVRELVAHLFRLELNQRRSLHAK